MRLLGRRGRDVTGGCHGNCIFSSLSRSRTDRSVLAQPVFNQSASLVHPSVRPSVCRPLQPAKMTQHAEIQWYATYSRRHSLLLVVVISFAHVTHRHHHHIIITIIIIIIVTLCRSTASPSFVVPLPCRPCPSFAGDDRTSSVNAAGAPSSA